MSAPPRQTHWRSTLTRRMVDSQIVTKERVTQHGEVYTAAREVTAMVNLVAQEADRIESRFLEPACGNGAFLAEILARKLRIVEHRYGQSQLEFERYAVLAESSLYGIDILEDNVRACRQRLEQVFEDAYGRLFKQQGRDSCRAAVRHILGLNIIWGDALTLKTPGERPEFIVFAEWSPVNGSLLKRRDFTFHSLLAKKNTVGLPLFSDTGEDAFVPEPLREYPPIHFLDLGNA